MATHIGFTITVLVLLMTTVEIKGNRFGNITYRKRGAVYPSVKSPTPAPSRSESPLTLPPIVPHAVNSPYRGGSGQLYTSLTTCSIAIWLSSSCVIILVQLKQLKGGAIYPSEKSPTPTPSRSESPLALPPIVAHAVNSPYRGGSGQLVVTAGRASP
ncbi:hypothetical protein POM88_026122 [Heracleum sosnowskyi]|uniref:Uncharacterized protein n=1 Tax=Heracleum sosnowskyi TaxID=360622 RepID=A0AAD8I7M3_9APIA|nr:hypothetical protein POM88_026122 [Heracleum sosnowskyi]